MQFESRTLKTALAEPSITPTVVSWILAGIGMILALRLHLLSALLPGLLVYVLVRLLAPRIQKRFAGRTARLIALVALATVTMGILILLIMGTVAFFKSDIGNLQTLFEQMQRIITDARAKLPLWIVDSLPGNVDDLKSLATVWLDEHSKELQHTGKEAMHLLVHLLFGMVIGALISLHEGQPISYMRPLAAALTERAIRFGDAFRRIVFAQVRISALNFLAVDPAAFRRASTFGQDAYCPDVSNWTPSSHWQPDLEYSDYHCRPVALNLRSGLCTGLFGDHS
jgi:predicted PurR-regulated permease PerM